MIPKTLFFIWIGKERPPYVDFAINTFKEVNPEFEIRKYFFDSIFNSNNEDVEFLLSNLNNNEINYLKENCDLTSVKSVFTDKFKYFLIKKYGGIYLDCDTFPIRPFDDELLKLKSFRVTRSYCCNHEIHLENFFIGSFQNINLWNNECQLLCPVNTFSDKESIEKRKSFFNSSLKYGEHCNDPKRTYIDHYNHYSWENSSEMLMKTAILLKPLEKLFS